MLRSSCHSVKCLVHQLLQVHKQERKSLHHNLFGFGEGLQSCCSKCVFETQCNVSSRIASHVPALVAAPLDVQIRLMRDQLEFVKLLDDAPLCITGVHQMDGDIGESSLDPSRDLATVTLALRQPAAALPPPPVTSTGARSAHQTSHTNKTATQRARQTGAGPSAVRCSVDRGSTHT